MDSLIGRTIAIPETRELDVFSSMLERRGATVVRCPLVAILDAPDPEPVLNWIRAFNTDAFTDLILLTGEGLRRLLSCIERNEPSLREPFIAALARVRKITRGPKPARVLRELGLKADLAGDAPTTDGVISALTKEPLQGKRFGVQLYGSEPNTKLIEFLNRAGATVSTVAPYIYADKAADEAVSDLLQRMAGGEIDAIAFTSTPQVERIFAVGPEDLVRRALSQTQVAAIGPVVAEALAGHQIHADLMPRESFFMKPLTTAMEEAFGKEKS
ncbi:MAG TPA: uroporphyrinogen-III synthase [Steroidobacteraceae bacterium]|nr:uroporphyrinogen-III synthase [Steroidobacteraceae bacterium]